MTSVKSIRQEAHDLVRKLLHDHGIELRDKEICAVISLTITEETLTVPNFDFERNNGQFHCGSLEVLPGDFTQKVQSMAHFVHKQRFPEEVETRGSQESNESQDQGEDYVPAPSDEDADDVDQPSSQDVLDDAKTLKSTSSSQESGEAENDTDNSQHSPAPNDDDEEDFDDVEHDEGQFPPKKPKGERYDLRLTEARKNSGGSQCVGKDNDACEDDEVDAPEMQDLQLSQDGEEDPGEHLMTILNNLKWKNGRFRCFFAFRDVRCQHTAFLTVVVLHRTVKNKEQLKLELQQPMTHFNGNNTAVRRRACQAKLAEGEMLKNVFRELVILSATAYEGDGLTGAIVPAAAIDPAHVALSFRNPVNIDDIKGTRKLLEMTSPDGHALILDTSRKVVGLCRLAEIKRDKVVVMFTKPLCWELKISSGRGPEEFTTFYTVSASGGVSLPKERLGQADVNAAIQHTFGNRAHSHAIWTVIGHALRQKHGTMVVISNAAEAEANRLSSQSTKLKQPRLLDEGLVLAVTSIDGAVLLDRKGKCHAIGVILDGPVSRNGDSSRGARFNSGWRYYDQAKRNKQQVLIVIVSEDGYVTMIPQKP